MIDDALKSARMLHRSIMALALITITFSFSIDAPTDLRRSISTISSFGKIDFLGYDEFVAERIATEIGNRTNELSVNMGKLLREAGFAVSNLNLIGESVYQQAPIEVIAVRESVLSAPSTATMNALDAMAQLRVNKPVEVLLANFDELAMELREFLSQNANIIAPSGDSFSQRISVVQSWADDDLERSESVISPRADRVGLYFEIHTTPWTAAPVFQGSFSADVVTVSDSSFVNWVRSMEFDPALVAVGEGTVHFLGELNALRASNGELPLEQVVAELEREVAQRSPENRTISILGAEIPGNLVIFASPLAQLALAFYFWCHSVHLLRISTADRRSFAHFAWLPLILSRLSGPLSLFLSAGLLPVSSIGILFWQLAQFGPLSLFQLVVMGIACLAILAIGGFAALIFARLPRSA